MIATVHKGGASFKGVVDYCLSEGRAREDERDELRGEDRGQDKAGRVAWSETRNVAAEDPRQAARVMAATASRSEDLKQLAGVKAGGRALEKPVCHYSLSWAKDEKPEPEGDGASGDGEPGEDGSGRPPGGDDRASRHGAAARACGGQPGVGRGWAGGEARQLLSQALPVGRRIRAGAGAYPLSAAGGEQRREGSWGVGPVCVHEAGAVSPGAGPRIGDPPPA